jgi:ABC-type lipoprotein release transport system permease subunit
MTVVGIYDLGTPEIEKRAVFIPLAAAQTLYNLRDQATEVAIFLRQIGTEDQVMAALQPQLPGYEVDSWQTLRPEIRQTFQTKLAFSNTIGMVVLLIGGIGILNLMLMAAFERTREMGVLAALGMRGRQIMGLFVSEGALIGLVGTVIGCVAGALVVAALGQVGISLAGVSGLGEVGALLGDRLYPVLTPDALLSRGALAIAIAALAALYPAWQASRREPAQALHQV